MFKDDVRKKEKDHAVKKIVEQAHSKFTPIQKLIAFQFMKGLSLDEIASINDMTISQVKSEREKIMNHYFE